MSVDGLAGKRILVVEDEYFIAADIRRALERAGAKVVGPVASLSEGLALSERPLDGALLDIDLDGARSYPLADKLMSIGVPFLFVTGFEGWSLPDAFKDSPRVAKPSGPERVLEVLETLLD